MLSPNSPCQDLGRLSPPCFQNMGPWLSLVGRLFSEQSNAMWKGDSLEARAFTLAGPDFLHLLVHRELLDAALPRKPVCMHMREL